MKLAIASCVLGATMLVSVSALADTTSFKVGGQIDLSAPSGAAVGLDIRLPYVPWFKVGGSVTYLFAPGIRGNILIDPIDFPVGLVGNVDLGHQFSFKLPGTDKSPDITFDYVDLQAGLGIGARDGFRFLILGGASHISLDAANFQNVVSSKGVTIGSPHVDAWIPSAKLAGTWLF